MVLVVGASGYLGGLICKELVAAGRSVRAMVRPTSDTAYLRMLDVTLSEADLERPASLPAALDGCQQIIFTAGTASPAGLITAAEAARVEKLVYLSALMPDGPLPPLWRCKAEAEGKVRQSLLDYTILRCGSLMEVGLALLGSSLPTLLAAPEPPHPLDHIERKGTAHVFGRGTVPQCYVAAEDVARLAVASLENPFCRRAILQVGTGPMTALQAVDLFSQVLGRPVRVRRIPLPVLRMFGAAAGLFSTAAGDLVRTAVAMAETPVTPDPTTFRHAYPDYRLQTVTEFLRERVGWTQGKSA